MATTAPTRTTKSDATRASILAAAREAFREHGYDAAGVRMIAALASIDPAMVIRYFGNKEGLFLAAVDVDLELPDLVAIGKSRRGEALVEHLLSRWEGPEENDVLITLLRSAATNDVAADRVRKVFAKQVRRTLSAVVDQEELDRRAALVATEMLGLALTRYLLRLPVVARQTTAEIVRDHGHSIQRHLHGVLPSPTARAGSD